MILLLGSAVGQSVGGKGFNRPPAGVDEALRARILEFYNLEQAGRFRQAESLVCEDSRDRYYDMEKQRWTSVELIQTLYEEGFTRARATMALGTTMPTFSGPIPVKAPLTSLWHFENGAWCRYIPEPSKDGVPSPFGIMRPSAGPSSAPTPFGAGVPVPPSSPQELASMVKLSRAAVSLPVAGGTETVEILNGMPGRVDVRMACPSVAGLQCKLSSEALSKGGKATLTLTYTPEQGAAPAPGEVHFIFEPLGTRKTVRVEFRQ